MKKKTLSVIGVFLYLSMSFVITGETNKKETIQNLAFNNIEAMSRDEDGTKVGTCFRDNGTSGDFEFKILCDSRTDENTIYPCESTKIYSSFNKEDRCTK